MKKQYRVENRGLFLSEEEKKESLYELLSLIDPGEATVIEVSSGIASIFKYLNFELPQNVLTDDYCEDHEQEYSYEFRLEEKEDDDDYER